MSSKVTFDVLARSTSSGFEATNAKIVQQAALANKASKDSEKQVKLLGSALLAAGSAAIPFGAAASAALIGATGAAAAAGLAVTGLVKDWKAGTLQGTQFAAQVKTAEGNLGKLQQTAAAGVLPGFTAGLKAVNKQVPELNNDVRVLSGQLGQVAGHTAPALLSVFHQLSPVMEDLGTQLVSGSKRLQQWASSTDSIRTFGAYAENQLPLVNQTIANVGVTAGHAIEALAPFGSTLVKGVNAFSAATRAIPLGALQTALPLLAGAKIGSTLGKSAQASEGLIGKFAKTSSLAGSVVSKLGVAGAVAGVALGGLSAVMGIGERNAAKYRAQVDKVTQALQNGTAAQAAWVAAQNTGADAATKLGLSQKQVVAQIEQGQKATGAYATKINGLKTQELALQKTLFAQQQQNPASPQVQQTAKQLQDVIGQLDVLTGKAAKSGAEFAAAKKQLAAWASTQGDAALAAQITSGKFVELAKSLGIQSGDYIQAKAAADAHTASMRAATAEMILENNAAGLLNQSLQAFGADNLGVAQAQTAVASATNAAATALKDNKNLIVGNSKAALADQQALQAVASAAVQHGQAVAQQTGSTVKATKAINDDKAALEAQLKAHGQLTPAVQHYIDTLFKIPPLKKTQIDINAAAASAKAASLQRQINSIRQGKVPGLSVNTAAATLAVLDLERQIAALHGKVVQITVVQQKVGLQQFQRDPRSGAATGGFIRSGRVQRLAAGGPAGFVIGPGTGTSDTAGLFALSNGEYVNNAQATARNKAALVAGNHGATLGVVGRPAAPPRMHVTVGLTTDSHGNLQAFVQKISQDVVRDEAEFSGMTARMGAN